MEPFFLYARKSTEAEDRQILSIESQIKELKELATRAGVKIVDVLTECKSAKEPGRPVFNEMMKRIRRGEARGILSWRFDRLTRNPKDGGDLIWAIKKNNLKIITSTQTFSQTEDNTLLAYLEVAMAHKTIEDLSKNVKRGLRAKIEMGWLPGHAPAGYLNRKELEKGKKDIIKDPETFPLLRQMWDLMLTGQYKPPQILEIANNQWGFRTKKYKRTGGKPLCLSTLYKMFNNPFYAGWLPYNGELHRGRHEPMVSQTEFDRVQELLGRVNKPKPHHHIFAFTGLIRCGECGCLVTAENKQKVSKTKGVVHHYTYYHCTKRKRNHPCTQRCLDIKEMEKQILDYLENIYLSDRIKQWAMNYLAETKKEESDSRVPIEESLRRALDHNQKQLENLLQMRCRELLDDEEYLAEKTNLLQEQQRLKERLEKAKEVAKVSFDLTEKTLLLANQARDWFMKGSQEDKRVLLETVGSNLTLKDKKLCILAKKPFMFLENISHLTKSRVTLELRRLEPLKIGFINEKEAPLNASFSTISG